MMQVARGAGVYTVSGLSNRCISLSGTAHNRFNTPGILTVGSYTLPDTLDLYHIDEEQMLS